MITQQRDQKQRVIINSFICVRFWDCIFLKKYIHLLRVLNVRAVGYSVQVKRIIHSLRSTWLPTVRLQRRLQYLSYCLFRPRCNGVMRSDILFDLHQFLQINPQGWSLEIGVVIRSPDVRVAYCRVLNFYLYTCKRLNMFPYRHWQLNKLVFSVVTSYRRFHIGMSFLSCRMYV